jgi:hypothetical protein
LGTTPELINWDQKQLANPFHWLTGEPTESAYKNPLQNTVWKLVLARHWWLMPVIPATQEAEIRRIEVQGQPGQKNRDSVSKLSKRQTHTQTHRHTDTHTHTHTHTQTDRQRHTHTHPAHS